MTNKNYISGRNFEYYVKRYFESMGFFVIRSAGSHTPIDLLAVHKTYSKIYLIQCKHGKTKINFDGLKKLMDVSIYFNDSDSVIASMVKRKLKLSLVTPGLNLIPLKVE
jgi:Holliday junction resolvase